MSNNSVEPFLYHAHFGPIIYLCEWYHPMTIELVVYADVIPDVDDMWTNTCPHVITVFKLWTEKNFFFHGNWHPYNQLNNH